MAKKAMKTKKSVKKTTHKHFVTSTVARRKDATMLQINTLKNDVRMIKQDLKTLATAVGRLNQAVNVAK